MKPIRFVLIMLSLMYFFTSCGGQGPLELSQRGSLLRAANGNLYSTGCLRDAKGLKDVAGCSISDGESTQSTKPKGVRNEIDGLGGISYFNPFGFQNPGVSSPLNWGYPDNFVWDLLQFNPNSLNGFFGQPSQNMWGNQDGWLRFLFGRNLNNNAFNCNSSYFRCQDNCSISWLDDFGFDPGVLGNSYSSCGRNWNYNTGFGYSPGSGENILELRSVRANGTTQDLYTLDANQSQSYVIYHTACPVSGSACSTSAANSLNRNQVDYILSLIDGISTASLQPIQGDGYNCQSETSLHVTLKARNRTIPIFSLDKPCGQVSENPANNAFLLRDYFLQLVNYVP